jgi:hypothetical protein
LNKDLELQSRKNSLVYNEGSHLELFCLYHIFRVKGIAVIIYFLIYIYIYTPGAGYPVIIGSLRN